MSASSLSRKIPFSAFHSKKKRSVHKRSAARALFLAPSPPPSPVADPFGEDEDEINTEEVHEVRHEEEVPVGNPNQEEEREEEVRHEEEEEEEREEEVRHEEEEEEEREEEDEDCVILNGGGPREEEEDEEYVEHQLDFGDRIIIPFIRRVYLYVSNPRNGSVFLPEGGFMFPTPATLNRFKVFLARNGKRLGMGRSIDTFNSKTNLYKFRIKTTKNGPKRYRNPLFKENNVSVFDINVKAIKTLVDAAGEVDSIRRNQVSVAEKVSEALLISREIPVPGLHQEGRDAIYRIVEILAVAAEENRKVNGKMVNLTNSLLQV